MLLADQVMPSDHASRGPSITSKSETHRLLVVGEGQKRLFHTADPCPPPGSTPGRRCTAHVFLPLGILSPSINIASSTSSPRAPGPE
jgi:hypothetical protein